MLPTDFEKTHIILRLIMVNIDVVLMMPAVVYFNGSSVAAPFATFRIHVFYDVVSDLLVTNP